MGKEYMAANQVKVDNLTHKIDKIKGLMEKLEKLRIGKLLGSLFNIKSLWDDYSSFIKESDIYIQCYYMIPDPCPNDADNAQSIRNGVVIQGVTRLGYKAGCVVADATQVATSLVGLASGVGTGPVGPAVGIGAAIGIAILKWGCNKVYDSLAERMVENTQKAIKRLECYKKGYPKPDKDFPDGGPIIDPSGYVYEAVASNRVQDATATIYYREYQEDMYGDLHERVVLWNAAEYAQENPLFTDENGQYAWDVPVGDWQVRIAKDGYETAVTEWLPVPPPQLDVNIALSQYSAPTVSKVMATEQGVQVNFDKYMRPELLDTAHICLTKNGQKVEGTIQLLNREQAPDTVVAYASRLRFVPATPLAVSEKVVLTVKQGVESYARVPMETDFVQEFDVEKKVQQLVVDSAYNLALGRQRTLTIAATPADAAVGRKLTATALGEQMVRVVGSGELTFDQNGQAALTVEGLQYGTTALRLHMEDYEELDSIVVVSVKDSLSMITRAVEASRISGTTVYYGQQLTLSSQTPGATIYYTLDGTCPCEMLQGSVIKYEGPITLTADATIKAIAVAPDYTESEVTTFEYKVRHSSTTYELAKGWNWVSNAQAVDMAVSQLLNGTDDYAIDADRNNVATLEPGKAYRAYSANPRSVVLTGYAWNAAQSMQPLNTGWNWIGYPVDQVMTIGEAMAFNQPAEGDLIAGREGFAEFCDGQWQGTLLTLQPGKGYRYRATANGQLFLNTTISSQADTINTTAATPTPT